MKLIEVFSIRLLQNKEAQKTVDLLQLMLDAESDDMKLTPEDENSGNIQMLESEEGGIQWKYEKRLLTEASKISQ